MAMRSKCPHCGYHLVTTKHPMKAVAIRMTVALATRRAKPVMQLAEMYSRYAECEVRSGRKAVERMAKDGLLKRKGDGLYVAA
jgi:hypothetical protein